MATYFEVNIFFIENPKGFCRKFLVRDDLDLEEFGCVITTFLNTAAYHLFSIENDKYVYHNRFTELYDFDKRKQVFQKDYKLIELFRYKYKNSNLNLKNSTFLYSYDFGESYDFVGYIDFFKPVRLKNKSKIAYLLEGKGQAIFEDSKSLLIDYLEGRPLSSIYKEVGEWKPINFGLDNECYNFEDFDKELNIEEENRHFTKKFRATYRAYLGLNG